METASDYKLRFYELGQQLGVKINDLQRLRLLMKKEFELLNKEINEQLESNKDKD